MGALDIAKRSLDELGFYSKALEEAKGASMKKGTAQQWRNVLTKQGVKQGELNATGFNDIFAADPNRTMSKDEVVRFLTDRRVKLGEASSGGQELNDLTRRIDEVRNAAEDFAYRGYHQQAANARDELYDLQNLLESAGPRYRDYALPGGDNYIERRFTLQNPGPPEFRSSRFESSHWDEPDVVFHTRQSDRVGPNGERVLHLDEIQSDWAQAGRDQGFQDPRPNLRQRIAAAMERRQQAQAAHRDVLARYPDEVDNQGRVNGRRLTADEYNALQEARQARMQADPDWQAATAEVRAANDAYNEAYREAQGLGDGVMPGPFVTSTNDWVDLALKKAMIDAERGGYDAVAWTPGAEHAKRYNLSNRIDNIQYLPDDRELRVYGTDGGMAHRGTYAPEDLPGVIGKDNAKRLLEAEPRPGMPLSFYPEDMVWGGEGMTTFYDKMVADRARKLGRTLDPTKADHVELSALPVAAGDATVNLHRLSLTPAMKEQIRQGLPLFVGAPAVAGGALNALRPDEPTEFRRGGLARARVRRFEEGGFNGDPNGANSADSAGGWGGGGASNYGESFSGNVESANTGGGYTTYEGGVDLGYNPSDIGRAWGDTPTGIYASLDNASLADAPSANASPISDTLTQAQMAEMLGLPTIDFFSPTSVAQQPAQLSPAMATVDDVSLSDPYGSTGTALSAMATMPGAIDPVGSASFNRTSENTQGARSAVEFDAPGFSDGFIGGTGPGAALAPGEALPGSSDITGGLSDAAQTAYGYFDSMFGATPASAVAPALDPFGNMAAKEFSDRLPSGDPRTRDVISMSDYSGAPRGSMTAMGFAPVSQDQFVGMLERPTSAVAASIPSPSASSQMASLGRPVDMPVPDPRPHDDYIYENTETQPETGLLASISNTISGLRPDFWNANAGLKNNWNIDPLTRQAYDIETRHRAIDPGLMGTLGGTVIGIAAPPLGLASMVSGLLGGPTLSGVLSTAAGRNADTSTIGYGSGTGTGYGTGPNSLAYGNTSTAPNAGYLAGLTGNPATDVLTSLTPGYTGRTYLGASSDPTRYGYSPERVYFT